MKELWKRFLVICCTVVLIITGPGMNALADDITIEDIAVNPENEEILEESLAEQIDEEETIITIFDEGAIEQEKNEVLEGLIDETAEDELVSAPAAPAGAGPVEMKGNRDFLWPVPSSKGLSSCFKDGRNHDAIDIAGAPENADVVASFDGTVCEVGYGGGFGNYVIIRHDNYKLRTGETITLYSKYNHLYCYDVSENQHVSKGQRIGGVGHTGSDAVHLDFQIMTGKNWQNYNYHNISKDPFTNEFLGLPSNIWVASTSSCCGVGPTGCCCKYYVDYIKALYSTPIDTTPPTIEDVYIKGIDKNGYTIHCIVRDNNSLGQVKFPTWTSNADSSGNQQDDIIWGSAGAVGGIGYELNYRVNYSDHNNEKNCSYYTDIYCYDAAGNLSTYKTVTHHPDNIAPTITNIEITEITSEGYRITCTVTDNVQVSKVSFPVWTDRAVDGTNQDDIKWGEGTLSGNKATFYVKRSDHNGEYGLYHNHIYAHDAAENITSAIAPSVTVPDPRLQNDSDSPVITSIFNGHKYEVYDLSLGWKAAKSFCEDHGGHLVTITDTEENEAVTQLIRQGGKGYYHIGCSDEEVEGKWGWVTGEQFSYSNWDPQGEPSGNTTENWAMIVSIDNPPNKQFGEWVDIPEKAEDVGYYNYANSGFVCEYEMEERDLSNCQITLDEEEFDYTGTEKEPNVTVRYGDSLLSEGTDYYVSYAENVNAGDATVTITGKGNYSGSLSKTFTISAASITNATVTGISNKTYTGSAQTQSPTVKVGDKTLTNGTDYTLSYSNNTNAGTATVTITGKGNYSGSLSKTFTIGGQSIANATVTGISNKTYTGSAQTQNPTVKLGEKTLVSNTDYTLSYANNTNAGTATVTITGKGNYAGTISKTFTISAASIAGATVTGIVSRTYNGAAQTQSPTVKLGEKTLASGTDYTLSYANNTDAGTATVKVTGQGNYAGTVSKTFTISAASITGATVTGIANRTYNGTAQTQSPTVKLGEKTLVSGTDYTLSYANNTNAGTATIKITGKGNYAGTVSKTFTISAASIAGVSVTGIANRTYNGTAQTQSPTVKLGEKTLVSGTDYSLSYANNTNAGTATVKVTGKGNYTGTISKTFTINKAAAKLTFASTSIAKATQDAAFTNSLTKTTDGSVTFKSSNTAVAAVNSASGQVTIKGIGTATITVTAAEGTNYKAGSASYTLTVVDGRTDISGCAITLSPASYTYNGKERRPAVTVTSGTTPLTSGTDYTVTYTNNKNAGTATVTITGKGSYTGTNSATFTINKAAAKLTFENANISKTTKDAAFTNVLTKTTDGTVTFKSGNTGVATVNNTSGLVTIKGAGTATITATSSTGTNYKAGSASYTLTVTAPAAAGFSDVQDPTHPYYKAIYWAADAGITKGYPDGTFGIDRACTRSEAVMFLWRMAGKPAPVESLSSPFSDVPKSHAHYKAILWASQRGITKGYSDGTFGVNRTCTRGHIMTFIWRFKGQPTPKAVTKSPFSDVPKNHAYYKAILWGSQTGVTKGFSDGTFGINKDCTRGQIVTFLYRIK